MERERKREVRETDLFLSYKRSWARFEKRKHLENGEEAKGKTHT
jgi:hypothetical protein